MSGYTIHISGSGIELKLEIRSEEDIKLVETILDRIKRHNALAQPESVENDRHD